MARLIVGDYVEVLTNGIITAVDYQVAKDENFEQIIDESMDDKINLEYWDTPLPKREEDKIEGESEFYSDLEVIYGRIRIHIDNTVSDWVVIGPYSQTKQKVLITENGEDDKWSDSHKLGWRDDAFLETDPDVVNPNIK